MGAGVATGAGGGAGAATTAGAEAGPGAVGWVATATTMAGEVAGTGVAGWVADTGSATVIFTPTAQLSAASDSLNSHNPLTGGTNGDVFNPTGLTLAGAAG